MNFTEYFQNFQNLKLIFTPTISEKIKSLSHAVISLSKNEYPKTALPFLPLSQEEIENLVMLNLNDDQLEAKIDFLDQQLINFREVVRENFGIYCILNEQLINDFSNILTAPFIELAAGNGFLSARLKERGLKGVAVDNFEYMTETKNSKEYFPVIKDDAVTYFSIHYRRYSSVILAWSPDNSMIDQQILKIIRYHKERINFFVIGERNGQTNSSEFWADAHFINLKKMIKLNRSFSDFDLYHDRIYWIK